MARAPDDQVRVRVRALRGAATIGGLLLLLAGLLASLDRALSAGLLAPVAAFLMFLAGSVIIVRARHASARSATGLTRDFLVAGCALAAGGVVEVIHILGFFSGRGFDIVLGITLGVAGAFLLTAEPHGLFRVELGAIRAVRLTGLLLALAAAARLFAVGQGDPHGAPDLLAMLCLASAGAALLTGRFRTAASAWRRL